MYLWRKFISFVIATAHKHCLENFYTCAQKEEIEYSEMHLPYLYTHHVSRLSLVFKYYFETHCIDV